MSAHSGCATDVLEPDRRLGRSHLPGTGEGHALPQLPSVRDRRRRFLGAFAVGLPRQVDRRLAMPKMATGGVECVGLPPRG